MADAILVAAAKAVYDAIDGHDFGIEFDLERSYADWELERDQEMPLRVDVVPFRHSKIELASRAGITYEVEVDIAVRMSFGQDSQGAGGRIPNEEIDPLVKLVEDIHEFFVKEIVGSGDQPWIASVIRAPFVPQHLRNLRQFTGLVRITVSPVTNIP